MPRKIYKNLEYFGRVDVFPLTKEDYYDMEKRCLIHRDRAQQSGSKKQYYAWYRNYIVMKIGINCGFRIETILQMCPRNINGGHITARESKTGKEVQFQINEELQKIIDDYVSEFKITNREYLFQSTKDRSLPITRQQAWRFIKQLGKESGVKYNIGCHSLRKSYARWFYDETNDLLKTQALLMHSDPRVTLQYICIEAADISDIRRNMNN